MDFKTLLNKLKSACKDIDAEFESYTFEGVSTIELTSPDNKVWVESGGVSLIGVWYKNYPETAYECVQDLIERVQLGLEDES